MFSVFTALILSMTTSVYAAEAEYDALDGSSPDKPEIYSEFSYYEGYNTGGGYEMMKFYAEDVLVDYVHSLYLPNYDDYNEGIMYAVSCPRGKYFFPTTQNGIVMDKITLTDSVEDGYLAVYDILDKTLGPFLTYRTDRVSYFTLSDTFVPIVDNLKILSCDWSCTSYNDVITIGEYANAPAQFWSSSITFNRKDKNLRVYDVDYICLWNGDFLGNYKVNSYSGSECEDFTSMEMLNTLDYAQNPVLAQSIFVSLLSDGSINQCSDEQLARLGVYRADKFDYDIDTNSCIPKNSSSILFDIPVPKDLSVNFDSKTELYEVSWKNDEATSLYPNMSTNLVVLFSGKYGLFHSGETNTIFSTVINDLTSCSNVEVINRVLSGDIGKSFIEKTNIIQGLRNKYDIDSSKGLITVTDEIHILLRNYYYVDSANVYHFSNWVDLCAKLKTNDSGEMYIDYTTVEYKGSASVGDISQSLNGGNTGTNADTGNASNVVKPDGNITYDGTIHTISGAIDETNVLASIKNGFGLLGGNGAFAIMSNTFGFIPQPIWYAIGGFVASGLVIALFKLIF